MLGPSNGRPYGTYFGIPGVDATYDYVVVGGGTAGLVVATRLSESLPDATIAIIEAGGFYEVENGVGSVVPAMATLQYTGWDPYDTTPLIDWNLVSTPQQGGANREMRYARGKCLGGSSARHYLVYHRGTTGTYQRWADLVGDSSYTFAAWKHYFNKSVTLVPPQSEARHASSVIGADGDVVYDSDAFTDDNGKPAAGPMQVTWGKWMQASATFFQDAMEAVGIPRSSTNFQSGKLFGSAWTPGTVRSPQMTRDSSKTAFLDSATARGATNIKIYTQCHARRILFSSERKATGVAVATNNHPFTLTARHTVVLSAGVFHSPQLLMLSGIGPAAHLAQHSIPLLVDLPAVGANMQDHASFAVSYRLKHQTNSRLGADPAYAKLAMSDYLSHATGPLTSIPAVLAFEKLPRSLLPPNAVADLDHLPADWPDIEYLIGDGHKGWGRNYAADAPRDTHFYASLTAIIVAPTSRGTLALSSPDPTDQPVINPNLLATSTDASVALAAFTRLRAIGSAMESAGATIGTEFFPGHDLVPENDPHAALDFIRRSYNTTYHAACTCAMGKAGDVAAVVDAECRVFGTQGLRVVDASAFPVLPPGHPQATVYALAEKIADGMVREAKGA